MTFSLALAALLLSGSLLDAHPSTTRASAMSSRGATGFFQIDEGAPAMLPRALTSFGAEAHIGWLYVIGGYHGTPHQYNHEDQSGAFYRLNLLDGTTWEVLPGNGIRRQSVQLLSYGEQLLCVGGMEALNARGETTNLRSSREAALFDPVSKTWKRLPDMPHGRSSHAAAIVGDHLYVIGGWDLHGDSVFAEWHDTMLRLNLSAPEDGWTELPSPVQRRALGAAVVDETIVIVGGFNEASEPSTRVDLFDTASNTWSTGPAFPGNAFGISVVEARGELYASGMNGVVYQLDPKTGNEWSPIDTWTFPRFFHELVADQNGVYAVGGIMNGQRVRHVERMPFADQRMRDGGRITMWELPFPLESKNRQGVFLHDDRVFIFGGNNSTAQHDFEPDNFVSEGVVLSLPDMTLSPMASYPDARQTLQTAVIEAETGGTATGISVGGFGHDGVEARTFADVFLYDFGTDTWSEGHDLVKARSQFGLALHEGALWVFGGHEFDANREAERGFEHQTSILRAEVSGGSIAPFETIDVTLPRTRRAFAGASLDGQYYLIGGLGDGFQVVDVCDVFDFERRSWSTIPSPSTTRIGADLVALDGRLYLAGGSAEGPDGFAANPSIEVFDPKSASWTTLVDELPISPRNLRMFAYRGKLLIVSTHDSDEQVLRVLLIDPTTSQPVARVNDRLPRHAHVVE